MVHMILVGMEKKPVAQAGSRAPREYAPTAESIRRGQALEQWLSEHEYDQAAFGRDSGISKMTINLYLRGALDIAGMHQRTVEKLLRAMHVSDSWAWDYFEIPRDRRASWRTFRSPPMGHGDPDPQQLVTLILTAPMSGEGWSAPAGAVVTYDATRRHDGLLVVSLPGRYLVAQADAVPPQGELLGQLLSLAPASRAQ